MRTIVKIKKPVWKTGDIKNAKCQGRNLTRLKDIMETYTRQDFVYKYI